MSKYSLLMSIFIFTLFGCSDDYKVIEQSNLISTAPELKTAVDQKINELGDQRGYEKIDFENSTYVIIAAGKKNSGGYTIKIQSLKETDDEIVISAKEISPGSTATLAVIENPAVLVCIEKTNKKINLEWIK